ncbi:hypothetical protein [Beijerinckia sp. L45]|uniref:hypothetical protein n=1 Tax=Beijerinckia sp. L45 TaxID=1641855 RepID=UPI00131BC026|nr:hypothetical protein [Beijerinckia sp. L45]
MHTLVIDEQRQVAARKALLRNFAKGAVHSVHTFKSPGGEYRDAPTHLRQDLGIWASIGEEPGSILAFGVGQPHWQIGIEVKIPAGRSLHSNGQVVEDDAGRLLLAHQGGLGGNKFAVGRQTFALLIEGFVRTAVADGDVEREMFVIADVDRASDLADLAAYVKQAERIRKIRRGHAGDFSAWALKGAARKAGVPENEEDGAYDRVAGRIEFKRRHGMVQNALTEALRKAGYDERPVSLTGGLRADLAVHDRGEKTGGLLFEIKASTGAQPHFTAIGQLLVYAQGHEDGLRKVLVTSRLPDSDLFQKALSVLGIEVLQYEIVGRGVQFQALDDLIASNP